MRTTGSWSRWAVRTGTVAAVTGAMSLAAVGTAYAADSGTARVVQGNILRIDATLAEVDNKIEVSQSGDFLFVRDNREIVPGLGCSRPVPTDRKLVQCPAAGIVQIFVYANAGDDDVNTLTPNTNIPFFLSGGRGDDHLRGQNGADTILGGSGNDTIVGFAGDDIIDGMDGHDVVHANYGVDTIDGGEGPDEIWAGPDGDVVRGGDGGDELHGEEGDDTILGDNDGDSLFGDAGRDHLDGGSGINFVDGGTDADDCVNGPTFRNCLP